MFKLPVLKPLLVADILLFFLLTLRYPTCAAEPQGPPFSSEDASFDPSYRQLVRRNAEAQTRLRSETPNAIRKMNGDEGQMFFLEYWGFEGAIPTLEKSESLWDNSSSDQDFIPPLLLHGEHAPLSRRFSSNFLAKRDFACPQDTTSCASIGRSNNCCANGLTCNTIQNTGLGGVGCCSSPSCSGQVSPCQNGYSACPGDQGGGCCIPGYVCNGDVGCVKASTTTVMVQTLVIVTPSTSSTTTTTTTTTTTPSAAATTTTSTTSTTSTTTAPPPSSTSTTSTSEPPAPINPAVRPTSLTADIITSTVASTVLATACPSGFYQCAAFFNGGSCCQVGRDCATYSCPGRAPASLLVSNGVTVVDAPTGAPPGGAQAGCANGWFTCGGDVGGGCCLSGFACGTASCTATGAAAASVSPIAKANEGAAGGAGSVLASVAGVAMALALAV